MRNMTLPKVAGAVNGKLYIKGIETDLKTIQTNGIINSILTCEAEGVVIDSRLCDKNYIFVAIKGEKTDGHTYIEQILDNGALAAICEKIPDGYEKRTNGAYILVDDCLKALRSLAAYYREQLTCKITGIVGSVGKTSTKELVASVLSQDFCTLKTEGNFNNEIGVPLTIFKIRDEHKMAVVEMGISGFGEMDRLGEIVKPDAVVMTNIGPCHLENLKDLEGVLRAKSEVLRHIKKNGFLILNSDDAKLLSLKKLKENTADYLNIIDDADRFALEHLNLACYGNDPVGSELKGSGVSVVNDIKKDIHSEYLCVTCKNLESKGVEGSIFDMQISGIEEVAGNTNTSVYKTKVNLQGNHQVMNSLSACVVGLLNGMSPEHIVKGIAAAVPMKGRCCPIRTDRFLVVDDSYNANPKSMMAGIDLMSESNGRKVFILGDMFELGTDEKELHAKVGDYAADKDIDLLICVGELSKNMYEAYLKKNGSSETADKVKYFKSREDLFENLKELKLEEGDTILVKASHGMGFSEVVDRLVELGTKYRFVKGRDNMRIADVMQLLSQTHWACKRSRETVEKAIENSLCFGIIDDNGRQVGFGRAVTDYATMFYISDVVIDKALHKHGLGKRFVEFMKSAKELEFLWGFLGSTKAKGFYAKCGFEPKDDFFMALPKTNVKGIFNV